MMRSRTMAGAIILGLVVTLGSCGKAVNPLADNNSAQNGIPVQGVGGFGSQCPYGTMGDPQPIKLTAFSCPSTNTDGDQIFQLTRPLLPVILQADCKKMEVTARTIQGTRIENRWNVLPDGRFFFTMDAGNATLANDGAGHAGCETPTVLEVAGLLKCADRDHVKVEVDATWHLGQTLPGTNPHFSRTACSIPTSCNLHGFIALNQCG